MANKKAGFAASLDAETRGATAEMLTQSRAVRKDGGTDNGPVGKKNFQFLTKKKESKKTFSLVLTDSLYDRLKAKSEETGTSMGFVVTQLLDAYL